MKTYKTSIELLVAQNASINPVMTAGAVTQQVEVAASTVQLTTTDNGTISSTLENSRINQLPMNGRNILNLAAESTPGLGSCNQDATANAPTASWATAWNTLPTASRSRAANLAAATWAQAQFPDPDSIQEVRVQTSRHERPVCHAGHRRHHHQVGNQQRSRLGL